MRNITKITIIVCISVRYNNMRCMSSENIKSKNYRTSGIKFCHYFLFIIIRTHYRPIL